MNGICALVSRHPLTPEQVEDLKGFRIVQVAPRADSSFERRGGILCWLATRAPT